MTKKIVLIPSGGTNLNSIKDAFEVLGFSVELSAKESDIRSADKIILPGVGRAAHVMNTIEALGLKSLLASLQQDVLGICVGMQILFDRSQEDEQECLHIIAGEVYQLPSEVVSPHMGWNQLEFSMDSPLLKDIARGDFVYFTHSFYAPAMDKHTLAHTTHDAVKLAAIVQKNNFYGVQFHPERSSHTGLQLLKNFIQL